MVVAFALVVLYLASFGDGQGTVLATAVDLVDN